MATSMDFLTYVFEKITVPPAKNVTKKCSVNIWFILMINLLYLYATIMFL